MEDPPVILDWVYRSGLAWCQPGQCPGREGFCTCKTVRIPSHIHMARHSPTCKYKFWSDAEYTLLFLKVLSDLCKGRFPCKSDILNVLEKEAPSWECSGMHNRIACKPWRSFQSCCEQEWQAVWNSYNKELIMTSPCNMRQEVSAKAMCQPRRLHFANEGSHL